MRLFYCSELMMDQTACEALRAFMEKEHSEENLDFLVAVAAFRKKFPSETKEVSNSKLISLATKIYEQFIAPTVRSLPFLILESNYYLLPTHKWNTFRFDSFVGNIAT